MPSEYKPTGTLGQIKEAEGMLSPEQAVLSHRRDEMRQTLSPAQIELMKNCDLKFITTERGYTIEGTIKGRKISVFFDRGSKYQATIDGLEVLPSTARELYEKYEKIAGFQTLASSSEMRPQDKTALATEMAKELLG